MLKDIRDSLGRPPRPNNNRDDNDDNDNNDNDNDDNDNDDNDNDDNDNYDNDNDDNDNDDNDNDDRPCNNRSYNNRPNDKYDSVFLNNLNTNLNNIQNDSENYARLIIYQNVTIGKIKEELTDKKKN